MLKGDSTEPVVARVERALGHFGGASIYGDGPVGSVAEVLLHRAAIEDGLRERRSVALGRYLSQFPDRASGHGWPLDVSALTIGAEAGVAAEVRQRDTALQAMVGSDLPDTGDRNLQTVRRALEAYGASEPATVTRADIERYLQARDSYRRVVVADVGRLTGGFSKETLRVSLVTAGGPEDLVFRMLVDGRLSGDLLHEFEVLRFVWEQGGVPVAEPLWLETDTSWFGRPFSVSRFVPGCSVGDAYGPGPKALEVTGLDLAQVMARLHSLDVRKLESVPLPRMVDRAELLAAVDRQRQLLSRSGALGEHGIYLDLWMAVLSWLEMNVPAAGVDPVLLHGDPGFHNLVVEGGRVAGLFDWEMSHIGQREQDLAYVRPRIAGLLSWSQFLTAYCGAGGIHPDPARLQFHAVWQDTRNGIVTMERRRLFLEEAGELADAVVGILLTPILLRSALRNAFEYVE